MNSVHRPVESLIRRQRRRRPRPPYSRHDSSTAGPPPPSHPRPRHSCGHHPCIRPPPPPAACLGLGDTRPHVRINLERRRAGATPRVVPRSRQPRRRHRGLACIRGREAVPALETTLHRRQALTGSGSPSPFPHCLTRVRLRPAWPPCCASGTPPRRTAPSIVRARPRPPPHYAPSRDRLPSRRTCVCV